MLRLLENRLWAQFKKEMEAVIFANITSTLYMEIAISVNVDIYGQVYDQIIGNIWDEINDSNP